MTRTAKTRAPKKYVFDADDLTFGEGAELEDLTGVPIEFVESLVAANSVKGARAVLFVLARRENPDLKIEDLDGWRRADYQVVLADKEDDDPGNAQSGTAAPETARTESSE